MEESPCSAAKDEASSRTDSSPDLLPDGFELSSAESSLAGAVQEANVILLPGCRFYHEREEDFPGAPATCASSAGGGVGHAGSEKDRLASPPGLEADAALRELPRRARQAKPLDLASGLGEGTLPPLYQDCMYAPYCHVPADSPWHHPACAGHAMLPPPPLAYYQYYYYFCDHRQLQRAWDSYGPPPRGRRRLAADPSASRPRGDRDVGGRQAVASPAQQSASPAGCTESRRQTAVMLRNLPDSFSREAVVDMLDENGFAGCFDFVYYPIRFSTNCGFGYAFVNFVSFYHTQRAWSVFDGSRVERKVVEVRWAKRGASKVVGLSDLIAQYRNSPIMHSQVPDNYKPAIYLDGSRTVFPKPTRWLDPPEWTTSTNL